MRRRGRLARLIHRADVALRAAPTFVETMIVAIGRFGSSGRDRVLELLEALDIEIVAFDATLACVTVDAFHAYGKGRHPAALNFGDRCACALAASRGQPLLYKGDDFARTDIVSALA